MTLFIDGKKVNKRSSQYKTSVIHNYIMTINGRYLLITGSYYLPITLAIPKLGAVYVVYISE